MTVKKGDKIKADYTGTFDDGTVFDTSTHEGHSHPIEFEVGAGQVIRGFDEAVIGMNVADEKTFRVLAKDAYGEPDPGRMMKVPKSNFPKEAKEGMMLMLGMQNGGRVPARIVKIEQDSVTLDLNHPLAGKNLNFKIKIVEIAK